MMTGTALTSGRPAWIHTTTIVFFLTVALTALMIGMDTQTATAAPDGGAKNGTRLTKGTALYPRALRLHHSGSANGRIIAGAVSFDDDGDGIGAIFESNDKGDNFDRIGTVSEPDAANGLCCATLYELPRRVGNFPAGTLLWSASAGQDAADKRRMTIPLWASTDHGKHWKKIATVATSPNSGGLWEPELSVSRDGRLVLYVSDESDPDHSQTLVQATSADGKKWSSLHQVVAAEKQALRPEMPIVRRLPHGDYLMSYEICGPGQDCRQRVRRSRDGIHWGKSGRLGASVRARNGTHFRHAPTVEWYDDGSPRGRLIGIGQMLRTPKGDTAAGSGATVFTTRGSAKGRWRSASAPVRIADPYDNYCPNYRSSLLPMPEDGELLELATGYDSDGTCTAYFAKGKLPD